MCLWNKLKSICMELRTRNFLNFFLFFNTANEKHSTSSIKLFLLLLLQWLSFLRILLYCIQISCLCLSNKPMCFRCLRKHFYSALHFYKFNWDRFYILHYSQTLIETHNYQLLVVINAFSPSILKIIWQNSRSNMFDLFLFLFLYIYSKRKQ